MADRRRATDRFAFRPSVMAGLTQWVLFGGGNLAAQVKWRRLVVEYSHGQALHMNRFGGFGLTEDERAAGVDVVLPWTTGGGVGVEITPALHVLLELKAHRYEVRSPGGSEVLAYTTWTIGPGAFYDVYLYRGLFVQPSLRWWPNVASTLADDATLPGSNGAPRRHESHVLGLGGVFANVSLGYTFGP